MTDEKLKQTKDRLQQADRTVTQLGKSVPLAGDIMAGLDPPPGSFSSEDLSLHGEFMSMLLGTYVAAGTMITHKESALLLLRSFEIGRKYESLRMTEGLVDLVDGEERNPEDLQQKGEEVIP